MVLRSSIGGVTSIDTVENFIWFKLSFPTLVNSYLIGPLNFSVKLGMAFGVFVRLILTIKKQKHIFFTFYMVDLFVNFSLRIIFFPFNWLIQ